MLNQSSPHIKVLQYMHGDFAYFYWSEMINRKYCERHHYEYVISHEQPRDDRNVTWHKIPVIKNELNNCDYLLFVDADAHFYSHELKIEEELIPLLKEKPLLIAQDCVKESSRWRKGLVNTGVIFMKNDVRAHELLTYWDYLSDRTPQWCWGGHYEQTAFDESILKSSHKYVSLLHDYYLMNSPLSLYIRHYMGESLECKNKKIHEYFQQRILKTNHHQIT